MDVEYFGYSRKSPDDNEETEMSISNQNDLHKLICDRNGWHLNCIEEDRNISGDNMNRRGILLQIKRCKKFKELNPNIDVYLGVKDSKRFSRNNIFFRQVWEDLSKYKIKIYSISKSGFLNYSDMGDRLIGSVNEQAVFDGKKYAELSEELKISKGLPCVPAPFGYEYIEDNYKNKVWNVIKKDAKIILGVVSDYANKRFYADTIKDFKINKSKYYRIIKNAKLGIYSGFIVYNHWDSQVKYKGIHEPIISEELYNKINTNK